MIKKRVLILLIVTFAFGFESIYAQDLNARVQILSPKIQSSNKRTLDVLQTAIKDFLNGRKWTNDAISPQERIDCNFIINITDWDGASNFKAEAQIQSSRPVFGSSYNSTLLNIADREFSFNYTEGQLIEFSDQSYQSNLGSLLAFYAYMILGFDYDSFSPLGGTPYFQKAQNVVNNAQSAAYNGWKSFDSNRNRYWLSENINDHAYGVIRDFYYSYHRNGLDKMSESNSKSLKSISTSIESLQKIDQQKMSAMLPQIFFTAKADEFIALLAKADKQDKTAAFNVLNAIDPANGNKYQSLRKN